MDSPVRILFLADSHLGFDLPARPRVERRRRGPDFVANYETVLGRAVRDGIDVVVHGGDVFDRPRVSEGLAWRALRPLTRLAEAGIPVLVVPGNHERSRLPHARFARHPLVHVFDRPRTFAVTVRGRRLAFSGFPYERRDVRTRFAGILERTGWRGVPADARFLCLHHCVEGATVGPSDFTFRGAPDVIRCADLPAEFTAVLSGHIHRHQVLTRDLDGNRLASPVLYPGSVEKTSFAERGEQKGCMILEVEQRTVRWRFERLPSRPMVVRDFDVDGASPADMEREIRALFTTCAPDAIVRIGVTGTPSAGVRRILAAARLRRFALSSMTVELRIRGAEFGPATRARRIRRSKQPADSPQLELGAGVFDPALRP